MTNEIETRTLQSWLDAGRPVTVLDIRAEDDRLQWAIPGSVHVDAYAALRNGDAGALSDRIGRKPLIVWGMWVQAAGIGVTTLSQVVAEFAAGAVLLGMGTAMVYPTLLAAIGDVAHPGWRASAVGVYRLWRDLGYAIGALLAGITADAFGLDASMWVIAALTFASGAVSAARMTETLPRARPT